jgi:glycerol-3-phosphate acyltransferase PlsY
MLTLAIILVLSYLAGSIPASVWTGKLMYGLDVREHGSGNAGATNAFRVLGFKAGVISLLVDMGKGALAAGLIAQIRLGMDWPAGLSGLETLDALPTLVPLLAGLAAMVGHLFPIFAGFKGGKGAATAAGLLFAVAPLNMLIVFAVFVLILLATRYVSLASVTAAALFPALVTVRLFALGDERMDAVLLGFTLVMASGIIYAHRGSIRRLRRGEEAKIRSFRPGSGMRGEGGAGA